VDRAAVILSEIVNIKAAAINDAFQGADGNIFGSMDGDDDLAAIGMTPFFDDYRIALSTRIRGVARYG
jgi:hypothetical protein